MFSRSWPMQGGPREHRIRPQLLFYVADATDMGLFPDGSFDVVVDKGCLDCFVSSRAYDRAPKLLKELSRVLADDGLLFLLAVCDADIAYMLETGEIRRAADAADAGQRGLLRNGAQIAHSQVGDLNAGQTAREKALALGADTGAVEGQDRSERVPQGNTAPQSFESQLFEAELHRQQQQVPLFYLDEVVAWQQKHLFIARKVPRRGLPQLTCFDCGAHHPYPLPTAACGCGVSLERFALS